MVTLKGTVKFARAIDITTKKNEKMVLLQLEVVDELGTTYSCQMWPDDPQHTELVPMIDQLRRQRVQLDIASYSVRIREFKDGTKRPQVSFIMTNVAAAA
jgi:hypothetical protein